MNPISSLVTDIEAALQDADGERRTLLLHRITNLFIEQLPDLNDDHVSVFDEVILCLAAEIELAARIELSEKIADLTRGPRQTVQNLALDQEIRVAQPVLERSPCIDVENLQTIAQHRSEVFLDALSRRKRLPSQVTDILAQRGGETTIQRILQNSSLELSELGLRALADRATSDSRLYRALKSRPDLALRHIGAILEAAKQKARTEIRDLTDQIELIDHAIDIGAAAVMINPAILELADYVKPEAQDEAYLFSRAPREGEVIALINHGRINEALAAIAHLAGLPRETVKHAFSSPHFDPLLFIVRAIEFQWSSFLVLLKTKNGGSLSQAHHDSAFSSFHALSLSTARRVMRFISARTAA
jgi:uncharacterized protein (DUF2336 family)